MAKKPTLEKKVDLEEDKKKKSDADKSEKVSENELKTQKINNHYQVQFHDGVVRENVKEDKPVAEKGQKLERQFGSETKVKNLEQDVKKETIPDSRPQKAVEDQYGTKQDYQNPNKEYNASMFVSEEGRRAEGPEKYGPVQREETSANPYAPKKRKN